MFRSKFDRVCYYHLFKNKISIFHVKVNLLNWPYPGPKILINFFMTMTDITPAEENSGSTFAPDAAFPKSGDYYFDSYAHFGIHEEMLKDEVRTVSYRNAILRNKHLFEGKVVLDVGCGTGILSMFAAQAGARLVIGVDMSGIIEQARKIVKVNGFEDQIVLLQGKMEEVQLPVDKVDIIISEWMGYFLLYESMLDTVLYARDRYLVPGGRIFPDKATMILTAIEDAQYKDEKITFWEDVYGFDMSCIKDIAIHEPLVDIVNSKSVVSDECTFKTIDILTCTKEDLSFSVPFSLKINRTDYVHALLAFFDIEFSGDRVVTFGTGPFDKSTHWKQTVLYLPEDLCCEQGDKISGRLVCRPNEKNHRHLDIALEYDHSDSNGTSKSAPQTMIYYMA